MKKRRMTAQERPTPIPAPKVFKDRKKEKKRNECRKAKGSKDYS